MSNELVSDDVVRLPLQKGELLMPGEEPMSEKRNRARDDFGAFVNECGLLNKAFMWQVQEIEDSILRNIDAGSFEFKLRPMDYGPIFKQPAGIYHPGVVR